MTLGLVLSFAILVLLLVLALLWSSWPAWLKGLLVVGVTCLYFFADEVVHRMWGWPSPDAMPERFVLLAAVIDEPAGQRAGGLYIWVNAIEDGKPAAQPRAFQLPYDKDLHSLLNDGMKKIREGVTQIGTSEPKAGKKGLAWLRPGHDETVIKLRDMPVPQLPEK
ncbi:MULTISPECIES: hypothetical protein [unclassified Variovorax]|uniref:hypothetical protein n=1 Tax=unclassified Variovorax TaxID=663243 RepID=UPI001318BCEA|nr:MULTISPECIES: hypothetical protein [unclassified Variovorax]VTU26848.1 hypothetical protein SRS16CHR_03942 [Variovorax sp. SRS16]VTU34738.1 hypothetical protein E5CHR_03885 [Variovorax sp. PBL-E5]